MKLRYITCACVLMLFISLKSISQTNPRMVNENYMYTVFLDDFNTSSLDRSQWNVSHDGKKDCGIWVDGVNTVNQADSCLNLSIISSPGYTFTDWKNRTYTADYISGEVTSDSAFHYGSFECRAKYAHQKGSWPAFWLFGVGDGIPCAQGGGENDEIDISEFWSYTELMKTEDGVYCMGKMKLENNCHRYYNPGYCDDNSYFHHWWSTSMGSSMDDNFHVYKCIWTPDKIAFYKDNVLKNIISYSDNPQYFPRNYKMVVKLSQQVACLDCATPTAPQTSSFDYVKVRKFFLAPEITINNISCLASTATMDVDPAATNITWQLTPSTLFTTLSGIGNVANIAKASGASGIGKITYSFQMPGGETFTAEKDVWVGAPHDIELYCEAGTGGKVGDNYPLWVPSFNYDYDSIVWGAYPVPEELIDLGGGYANIRFGSPGTYTMWANNVNSCGYSTTAYIQNFYVYELLMSPNPASNEVEITISAGEAEGSKSASLSSDDAYTVAVLDIYGSVKIQKKYSGNKFTIPVSNLKDGNYFVKVSNNKINSTKQLIIKH